MAAGAVIVVILGEQVERSLLCCSDAGLRNGLPGKTSSPSRWERTWGLMPEDSEEDPSSQTPRSGTFGD